MKKDDLKTQVIFTDMKKKERDQCIKKFGDGEINVIITTNYLAKELDNIFVKLVIFFDVPMNHHQPDYYYYMSRIQHSGRFGHEGIALTLFDNDKDEKSFF